MTADQFAYWLQGFAELNAAPPTEDQWNMIREHLGLVFNKVTPSRYRTGRYIDPLGAGQIAAPDMATRTIC